MAGSSLQLRTCVVDLAGRQVVGNAEPTPLTPREVALLEYLREREGEIVTREALERRVWGFHAGVRSRAVAACVQRLRTKIEANPAEPEHLQTVRGIGYRLVVTKTVGDEGLLGRKPECAQLNAWLAKPGLFTVCGPPGVGKTRLVDHVVRDVTGPVRRCTLVDVDDLPSLRRSVAEALGSGVGDDDDGFGLVGRQGPLVLVLDGAEHLVARGVRIEPLVHAAPEARIVTTSQSPWSAATERVLRLGPLPLDDAARLFVLRVTQRGFPLTATSDVARLVARLDGLPLAIELVAGGVGPLGVADLTHDLERHLQALVHPAPVSARQATLRDAFDWSWGLLTAVEQRVVTALTAFPDQLHVEGLAQVIESDDELPDVVGRLVDRSWIRAEGHGEAVRMHLPQTVRWYVAQRSARQAASAARERHAAFVSGLADADALHARFQADLVAACERALDDGDVARACEHGIRAAKNAHLNGSLATGARLLRRLREAHLVPDASRIELLVLSAEACWSLGHRARGDRFAREAAQLARESTNVQVFCSVQLTSGFDYFQRGDFGAARRCAREGLTIARGAGDVDSEALLLRLLGHAELEIDGGERARAHFEAALAVLPEENRSRMRAYVDADVASAVRALGRLGESQERLRRVTAVLRQREDRYAELMMSLELADLGLARGVVADAKAALDRAEALAADLGDLESEATRLHLRARLSHAEARYDEVEATLRAALRHYRDRRHLPNVAMARLHLATHLLEVGRLAEASGEIEAGSALAADLGLWSGEACGATLLARLAAQRGDGDRARDAFDRSMAASERVGDAHRSSTCLLHRGLHRLEWDDDDGADLDLGRALRLTAETGGLKVRALTLGSRAVLHARRGEPDEAQHALDRAQSIVEHTGMPYAAAWLSVQRVRIAARPARDALAADARAACERLGLDPRAGLLRMLRASRD